MICLFYHHCIFLDAYLSLVFLIATLCIFIRGFICLQWHGLLRYCFYVVFTIVARDTNLLMQISITIIDCILQCSRSERRTNATVSYKGSFSVTRILRHKHRLHNTTTYMYSLNIFLDDIFSISVCRFRVIQYVTLGHPTITQVVRITCTCKFICPWCWDALNLFYPCTYCT